MPELPGFQSKSLREKIKKFYDTGRNYEVHAVLKELSNKVPDKFNNEVDIELAKNYINELKRCNNGANTVLSTHSRGVLNSKEKAIIFDEDPYKDIFQIDNIKLSELIKVGIRANKVVLQNIISTITKSTPGRYYVLDTKIIDEAIIKQCLDDENVTTNLLRFIKATHYMIDSINNDIIHFLNINKFNENQKVIILSATPQIELYQKLYGDRVKVIDLSNIEQTGQIYQYTEKSFSRSNLNDFDIYSLKNYIGNIQKITFKKFKSKFEQDNNIMHYGNCVGYDGFNGMDIAVIGTPHQNELVYKLIGAYLGIDVNSDDCQIEIGRKVDWKGMRFNFSTYSNKELREIQLSIIESDLVQAVGRARTLRNDCCVQLFSNLPLNIAHKFEELNL